MKSQRNHSTTEMYLVEAQLNNQEHQKSCFHINTKSCFGTSEGLIGKNSSFLLHTRKMKTINIFTSIPEAVLAY